MKPLPAQVSALGTANSGTMPSLPTALPPTPGAYSTSNRRASSCPVQRAYPWLLCTSTMIAATFCLLYITKPVILPALNTSAMLDSPEKPVTPNLSAPPVRTGLMPSNDRLPGEQSSASHSRPPASSPIQAKPSSQSANPFEETNLRIQHILTAEAPGGHLARIDIDVPVLYQSRNLRWTSSEVAEARALLVRLADYQEKSQMLRAEGVELLDSWNRIVGQSIPNGELRADSPSLPTNQKDAADAPRPAGLNTTESIQIQSAVK